MITLGGLAEAMLGAAVTPKRGVMRHLEDDTAKDLKKHTHTPTHTLACACTHTFYPFIEKQLGDKQSGGVRNGARERERGNKNERVSNVMNEWRDPCVFPLRKSASQANVLPVSLHRLALGCRERYEAVGGRTSCTWMCVCLQLDRGKESNMFQTANKDTCKCDQESKRTRHSQRGECRAARREIAIKQCWFFLVTTEKREQHTSFFSHIPPVCLQNVKL